MICPISPDLVLNQSSINMIFQIARFLFAPKLVVVVTEVLLTMYVIASRRAPIEEALPIPHGYNVPNS